MPRMIILSTVVWTAEPAHYAVCLYGAAALRMTVQRELDYWQQNK